MTLRTPPPGPRGHAPVPALRRYAARWRPGARTGRRTYEGASGDGGCGQHAGALRLRRWSRCAVARGERSAQASPAGAPRSGGLPLPDAAQTGGRPAGATPSTRGWPGSVTEPSAPPARSSRGRDDPCDQRSERTREAPDRRCRAQTRASDGRRGIPGRAQAWSAWRSWPHLRPRQSHLAQAGQIDGRVDGSRVDAAVAEDIGHGFQAHARPDHLRGGRMPQGVGAA